jgi:hypothetical protein
MATEHIQFMTDFNTALVVVHVADDLATTTEVHLRVDCQFCGDRLSNASIEALTEHARAHIANNDQPRPDDDDDEVPF